MARLEQMSALIYFMNKSCEIYRRICDMCISLQDSSNNIEEVDVAKIFKNQLKSSNKNQTYLDAKRIVNIVTFNVRNLNTVT